MTADKIDLHRLAAAHLSQEGAEFPPFRRKDRVRAALDACGYGLAYFEGERLVAMIDHGTGPDFSGVLLTTRALVGRMGAERVSISLPSLRRATLRAGILQTVIEIETQGGTSTELPLIRGGRGLTRLLTSIADADIKASSMKVNPILSLSDEDPSGLLGLTASSRSDPRLAALVSLASARLAAGDVPLDAARSAAVRIRVLQRALALGRGVHRGKWVSPLRADDLAARLPSIFVDEPLRIDATGHGFRALVGEAPPPRPALTLDRVEDAVMDRLVDAAVTRTLGPKWAGGLKELLANEETRAPQIQMAIGSGLSIDTLAGLSPGSPPSIWASLRAGVADLLGEAAPRATQHLTAYTLEARVGGTLVDLASVDPGQVVEIGQRLLTVEFRCLAERLVGGTAPSGAELLSERERLDSLLAPSTRRLLAPPKSPFPR